MGVRFLSLAIVLLSGPAWGTALESACASKDPVLVFDSFSGAPKVDISGDDIPDLSHGEFVEKLAQLGGHRTERLNLAGGVILPDIEEHLIRVVDDLEKGRARYSRINFSQELPLKLAAFKAELFAGDPAVPAIDASNVAEFKQKILEKLWTERPDFRLQELYALFTKLEKLGVPFVIAAGNSGPGYVNLFSLMPGVITVAALNLDGTKRRLSADNALVNVWRQGSFVAQETPEGIDINDDGALDFKKEFLSSAPRIAERFAGKTPGEAVTAIGAEYREWAKRLAEFDGIVPNAAWNALPSGLYRVEDVASLPTVTAGTAGHFRQSGAYIFKNAEAAPSFFFEEQEGRIIFDPLKSGAAGQLNVASGTSYAAPSVCAGR